MSKILVIGHSVLDKIYYQNRLQEKPGGIFHAVNTLVNLGDTKCHVYLLTQTSNNSFKHFETIYKNVNLDYSELIDEIPTVYLNLYDDKERDECYNKVNKKLTLSYKIDFSEFDIILVNMVSGFDITYHDLKVIKRKSNCKIYFDVHTLSRGLDENGKRDFRKIPNIETWLENIDFLQMNENEMFTLFGKISEKEIIEKILEHNVEGIIITKGGKGVSCYTKNSKTVIDATKVNAKNFVGCGDSFGAAFCYHFSNNKNFNSATVFANFIAGIITTYQSIKDFGKLKDDIKRKYN
jgi:sugar/nucleoside kinase (ribokinase family)